MDVYQEAVRSADRKRYTSALARLKALLMSEPVTVSLDRSSLPDDAEELADALPDAIRIWSDALPDSPFRSADGSKANVTIKFVREMRDLPSAQGDIQAQRDFFWSRIDHSYKINATIRVVYRTGRRTVTGQEASGIIAHELGHLIGLDDVSEDEGLMGYFVAGRPKTRVEPEEIETAVAFRKMLRDKIESTGLAAKK